MNKAYKYALDVKTGVIPAPEQVKQTCINFLYEFDVLQRQDDYEYKWNADIEAKVTAILKRINFARGSKARKPMYDNLSGFQHFLLYNIFCWVYKEFPTKRKVQEVIFTVARKNAKSVLACIVHIVAFFIDEPEATHYIGSNTQRQSEIIFEEMSRIIKASPKIIKYFKVRKGYIEFMPEPIGDAPAKNCKIVALSGDADKADGTQVYVASVDELGADNNIQKMVASLETGQFGPRNPLIVKISTSYPIHNDYSYWQEQVSGLYDNTFAFANKYLGRKPEEDEKETTYSARKFGLAFLIDNPNQEVELETGEIVKRWEDQRSWIESNPLFAEVPSLWNKLYEDYCTKKNSPIESYWFKVKNLNIWLSSAMNEDEVLVDSQTLSKGADEKLSDWSWWEGKQVFIGIDLSLSRDNTAVSFVHYDHKNEHYYIKNVVFYPKGMEKTKMSTEGLPYEQWSSPEIGWSVATSGDTVNYIEVGKYIENIVKEHNLNVATVLYDDTYAHILLEYIENNIDFEMSPARIHQDAKRLGPVIADLQQNFYDGKVSYAPNKFLTSALLNSEIEFRRGKPYITKDSKRRNKIDSTFSTLNAFKGIMAFEFNGYFDSSYEVEFI